MREAKLWKRALEEMPFISKVIFAILPDPKSPLNVDAFHQNEFRDFDAKVK